MKITYKQLKETIERLVESKLSEEVDSNNKNQEIIEAFANQLMRLGNNPTMEDVRYVVGIYNDILAALSNPQAPIPEQLSSGFGKFYLNRMRNYLKSGQLDLDSLPPAYQLLKSYQQRLKKERDYQQQLVNKAKEKSAAMTPQDKAERERAAAYGGNPDDRPWGLGS